MKLDERDAYAEAILKQDLVELEQELDQAMVKLAEVMLKAERSMEAIARSYLKNDTEDHSH